MPTDRPSMRLMTDAVIAAAGKWRATDIDCAGVISRCLENPLVIVERCAHRTSMIPVFATDRPEAFNILPNRNSLLVEHDPRRDSAFGRTGMGHPDTSGERANSHEEYKRFAQHRSIP